MQYRYSRVTVPIFYRYTHSYRRWWWWWKREMVNFSNAISIYYVYINDMVRAIIMRSQSIWKDPKKSKNNIITQWHFTGTVLSQWFFKAAFVFLWIGGYIMGWLYIYGVWVSVWQHNWCFVFVFNFHFFVKYT